MPHRPGHTLTDRTMAPEQPPEDADLIQRIMEYLNSVPERTIQWAKDNWRFMNRSQREQLEELESPNPKPQSRVNDEVGKFLGQRRPGSMYG